MSRRPIKQLFRRLNNWCPSKWEECERCDAVVTLLRQQEPLGKECEKVLFDNLWELYAR
jgi:hypothetical protein